MSSETYIMPNVLKSEFEDGSEQVETIARYARMFHVQSTWLLNTPLNNAKSAACEGQILLEPRGWSVLHHVNICCQ